MTEVHSVTQQRVRFQFRGDDGKADERLSSAKLPFRNENMGDSYKSFCVKDFDLSVYIDGRYTTDCMGDLRIDFSSEVAFIELFDKEHEDHVFFLQYQNPDTLYHQFERDIAKAREEIQAEHAETIELLRSQIELLGSSLSEERKERNVDRADLNRKILQQRREYEQQIKEIKQQKAELEKLRVHTDYGYVYLFLDVDRGVFKIGKSKNPESRLSQLKTSNPGEIRNLWTIETSEMSRLESELHQRFASQRVNREWFALTNEDIQYIQSLS